MMAPATAAAPESGVAAPLTARRALADELAGMLERRALVLRESGNRPAAAEAERCAAQVRRAGRWPIALPAEARTSDPERLMWLAALVAGALRGLDTATPLAAIERGELLADDQDVQLLRVLDRARQEIAELMQGVHGG